MTLTNNILSAIRDRVISISGLGGDKVLLLAGGLENLNSNTTMLTVGDRVVVVSPSEFTVNKEIQDGSGRFCLFFEGDVVVCILTRSYADNILHDFSRLMETTTGSVALSNTIIDGTEQYYPSQGTHPIFAEPLRVSKVGFPQAIKGFSRIDIYLRVTWTQSLS